MSDQEQDAAALLRMNEKWNPQGYEITFTPGQPMQWHAKYTPDGSQWHAPTSQRLNVALRAHWSKPINLPGPPGLLDLDPPAASLEMAGRHGLKIPGAP